MPLRSNTDSHIVSLNAQNHILSEELESKRRQMALIQEQLFPSQITDEAMWGTQIMSRIRDLSKQAQVAQSLQKEQEGVLKHKEVLCAKLLEKLAVN